MNTPKTEKIRTNASPSTNAQPSSLVGRYFYSIENGVLHWQGRIVAHLESDHLVLVQFFSFAMGEDTDQRLIPLEQLVWNETKQTGWLLFDSLEQFRFAYEDGSARHFRSYKN